VGEKRRVIDLQQTKEQHLRGPKSRRKEVYRALELDDGVDRAERAGVDRCGGFAVIEEQRRHLEYRYSGRLSPGRRGGFIRTRPQRLTADSEFNPTRPEEKSTNKRGYP